MSVGGSDNANGNDDNIIFTIKDTKLYVSARDNQKLSKLHSKGFERSICWNEDKTKSDNKNTTNEFKYCLELNFLRGNRPFVLVYWNEDAASKNLKLKGITYQNKLLIIITSSSLEKTFIINQLILIQSDGKNLEI